MAVLLYLCLTAVVSSRRLWHDELYTFYIATAPSMSRLWQEIHLDLNPPLEVLAVRLSTELFGPSNYAMRLPSILAFLAGSLCLYHSVARRLGSWYGLLATAVLWGSPFFYYATEARPYALVIGFLGLTLLCWERAIEPERTTTTVWLLAFAISGMMASHIMAVLYVAPFCLAEVVRSLRNRRLDWTLWAALLLPCAIPFLYVKMMARFESSTFPPVFRASLRRMAESYYGSLKLEALPLLAVVLVALAIGWWGPANSGARSRGSSHVQWALIAGLLATPALVNVALMCVRGAYFDRYAFPVAFGYAFAFTFFLANRVRAKQSVALLGTCVLLVFVCVLTLGSEWRSSVWSRDGGRNSTRALQDIRPDLPLVTASGLTFLEMDHYENPRTVSRLYYLTDREMAVKYAHATIFEGLPSLKEFFPIRAHVVPYQQFRKDHASFLVLGTPGYPEDWLLHALLDSAANVRYLGEFPGPYKDSQLYEVSYPRS